MNPLLTPQEKPTCVFFRKNIAHLTRVRAFKTLIVASAEELKSFICTQSLPESLFLDNTPSQKV